MSKIVETTLGNLIEFQRGYDLPKSSFGKGKYPVVSSNGILGFHSEYKVLAPGITIGRSGTVGLPHYIETNFFPHNTSLFVKDFKGNNPKYIFYLLKTLGLNDRKTGSGVPTMNRNHLHPLKVLAHLEIDSQQKIASVLSALDSKIELNNRINAELEAMAKTLYDYWFVQFDFPDENGKPYKSSGGKMIWNDELKREIPEGWNAKRLAEITDVSNESLNPMNSSDKNFKHYSIPNFDETGTYKIEKGAEIKSNKFIVRKTDLLVSKLNPWFNRVIFSPDETDLICSTEFVVWRTESLAMKNYLFMIARDKSFILYCTKSAAGTSNSHKRVNPTVMMQYQAIFNEPIAKLFGTKIDAIIKAKATNELENQKLAELRDWLLPMLMNGQVTVGETENETTV
jgi:type I restriction enzyme, S subunit